MPASGISQIGGERMKHSRFIEAIGASVVGYYVCKFIDFVVTLLFD